MGGFEIFEIVLKIYLFCASSFLKTISANGKMSNKFNYCSDEHSACGVGFITSRKKKYTHSHLIEGLHALRCVEHRGACSADGITGDGAGIMTDIPFEMLGFEKYI